MKWLTDSLRISPRVLALLDERSAHPFLDLQAQACRLLKPLYRVQIDRSPVLAQPHTPAAEVDFKGLLIRLNGYLLDRSSDPQKLTEFLVFHELSHVLFRSPEAPELPDYWGVAEEDACDLVALYALQNSST